MHSGFESHSNVSSISHICHDVSHVCGANTLCVVCVCLTFGTPVTYSSAWGLSPSLFRLSAFFKVCFVPYANKACPRFNQSILSLLFFPLCKQGVNLFRLNASSSLLSHPCSPRFSRLLTTDVTDGPTDLRLFAVLASLALKNSSTEVSIPRHGTLMNFNSSSTKEFKGGKSQSIRSGGN